MIRAQGKGIALIGAGRASVTLTGGEKVRFTAAAVRDALPHYF